MSRRWNLITAAPAAAAAILVGGWAVSAGSSAGQPTTTDIRLCGTGTFGMDQIAGNSDQDHPDASTFSAGNEQNPPSSDCSADNSSSGSNMWTIAHSNINVDTERGTEHGELLLSGSSNEAGFDGHITEWDVPPTANPADPCTDGDGRTVYYQSGSETDCTPSFGPVGNFNTHGGASTGQHFRGQYGTIIFQQSSKAMPPNHNCDPGSKMYCIQIDLSGQTN